MKRRMRRLRRGIKSYKLELIIIGLVFGVMFICMMHHSNSFIALMNYFINEDAHSILSAEAKTFNVHPIIFIVFRSFYYGNPFDNIIIWSTNLFQLLLPFLAGLAAFSFYESHVNINKFIYYRKRNYRIEILKKINLSASKIAFAIYIAYLLFYFICVIFGKKPTWSDYPTNLLPRSLLLDILGNNFYIDSSILYWLLEGTIRFFFVPYVYGVFSCFISVCFGSAKKGYYGTCIYYISLCAIASVLSLFKDPYQLSMYINPSVIMASGTYELKTIPLLICSGLPLYLSTILLCINKKVIYD